MFILVYYKRSFIVILWFIIMLSWNIENLVSSFYGSWLVVGLFIMGLIDNIWC